MRINTIMTMRMALFAAIAIGYNSVAYAWNYFDGTYIWSWTWKNSNTCAELDNSGNGGRGVSYGINYQDGGDAYGATVDAGDAPSGVISVPTSVLAGLNSNTWFPVIGLGRGVFYGCAELTDIYIPDCISYIGDVCFSGCSGLTTINLPESIGSIGEGAFKDCSNLRSIKLPQSITSIEKEIFMGCTNLSSIELPANIGEIPYRAFSGCRSLANISIPTCVTTIDRFAFQDCSSLKCIVIPESVAEIRARAFTGCTGLKKAYVPVSLRGKLGLVNGKETAFDSFSVVEYYDNAVSHLVSCPNGETISIEKTWLEDNGHMFLIASDYDYETAATSTAANGMKVWECYVAGLDPTNENSHFEAKIEMKEGMPVVSWSPNLNEKEETRVYTIYGKGSLDDGEDWTSPTNSLHRFFKVGVQMP